MGGFYGEPFYGGGAIPEYDYGSDFIGAAAGLAGAILGVLLIVILLALAVGVVMYIFRSIALYGVAKRRGINQAWLAWVPIGDLWILGSISDQYQYVAKGKVCNVRKVLLWLNVANVCLSFGNGILSGVSMAFAVIGGAAETTAASAGISLLISLASMVVSIVLVVFMYIALYRFYESCNPGNAAMFLVLSILFGITQPFFMFACRNKDEGMPPRKAEAQPVQAPVFPVAEEVPAEPVCEETPVEEVPTVEETPAEETPEETE